MTPRAFLVEPPYGEPKMEPTGLLYLATLARQHGFAVDVQYESPKRRLSVEQVVAQAVAGGYDLVGVTAMTPTLPRALAILRGVKQARPGVLGVVGGYHATVADRKVLERNPEVDVAVRGEGEYTFLELLERRARGESLLGLSGLTFRSADGGVVQNELRPLTRALDELPFPDRSLGPGPHEFVHFYDEVSGRHRVRANVTSSRGCPYDCAFCVLGSDDPRSPISLRKWRARSPENVVDEVALLVSRWGVGAVLFAEDNFSVSPRRLEQFADLVLARGLDFRFSFTARANQVCWLERIMPKLKRAGLQRVEIGIESGSQAVLDRFAKGTKVEHNARALAILRENRVDPRIDFIMFEPFTLLADLEQNLAFLRDAVPSDYEHSRTVYGRLELHPGTDLQRQYLASGFVSGDPDEIIPYEFERPEVARIYQAMDRFYWDHQSRLDELKKRLHFLQVELSDSGRMGEFKRLVRELVYIVVPMHRMPLKLLEALVVGGRDQGHSDAELRRQSRKFEEGVDRLTREFDQVVAAHGLVETLRSVYDDAAQEAAPTPAAQPPVAPAGAGT